jgi:predicted transcriptional regulator
MSNDLKFSSKLLGLNKPQATVLHALHTKSMTLPEIAVSTRVPRTSLYYMLKTLTDRGLIHKQKRNNTWMWSAIPIHEVLRTHREALEQCTGKTNTSLSTSVDRGHVTVHTSNDATMSIFDELSNLPAHSRFYGIQPRESLIQAITNNDLVRIAAINQRIKARHLIAEAALHESGTDAIWQTLSKEHAKLTLQSLGNRSADTVRLPENFLTDTKAELYLYGNTVSIVNWQKEFGVSIQNDDVFELIKGMFDLTKYLLERYDQNEKIARKLIDL